MANVEGSLKVVVVTSMRNQSRARELASAWLDSSIWPELVVFVDDRSSDDTSMEIHRALHESKFPYRVMRSTWDDTMFAAGRPRDFGLTYALSKVPDADVFLFLDGDCAPSPDLVQHHIDIHSRTGKYPTVCFGARHDNDRDGTTYFDSRVDDENWPILIPGRDSLIVHSDALYDSDFTPACYGCNVSMNAEMVRISRALNSLLFNAHRVWCPAFDGQWGGEDPYMMVTAFRLGALCIGLDPSRSWVEHLWHDGTHRNNKHVPVLSAAINKFKHAVLSQQVTTQLSRLFTTRLGPEMPRTFGGLVDSDVPDIVSWITSLLPEAPEHSVEYYFRHYWYSRLAVMEKSEIPDSGSGFTYFGTQYPSVLELPSEIPVLKLPGLGVANSYQGDAPVNKLLLYRLRNAVFR